MTLSNTRKDFKKYIGMDMKRPNIPWVILFDPVTLTEEFLAEIPDNHIWMGANAYDEEAKVFSIGYTTAQGRYK